MTHLTTHKNKLIRIGMILTLAVVLFLSDGVVLFSSFVPASPGDEYLSVFGTVFDDARIARVPITSDNVAPVLDDEPYGIVVIDELIYVEP